MARTIFIGDAVFCAAIGFLAGALASGFGWNILGIGATIVGLYGIAALFMDGLSKRFARFTLRTTTIFGAVFLATFFSGVLYYHLYLAHRMAITKLPSGKVATFSATITDEPDVTAKYLLLEAELEKPYAGTITIFAPLGGSNGGANDDGYKYGDEIKMTSLIAPPQTPGDTPAAFPKKIELVAEHRGFWLREDLLDFKAAVLQKFNESLSSEDEAALLGGEMLGGTDGMSVALKSEMSASGTSYITAMYGYKIFVIAAFVEAALASFVGDDYIDVAIISHPQLDHFNGYNFILDHYRVGAFIYNGRDDDPGVKEWPELKAKIAAKGIPLVTLGEGDKIFIGGDGGVNRASATSSRDEIDMLSPNPVFDQSAELNDTGFVELIKTPEFRTLLTADIGFNVEDWLVAKYGGLSAGGASVLRADVLKVPHHGSKYSSGDAFLRAVSPRVAIIEVGAKNTYGHPGSSTLARLASDTDALVLRTDRDGTIEVYPDNKGELRVVDK